MHTMNRWSGGQFIWLRASRRLAMLAMNSNTSRPCAMRFGMDTESGRSYCWPELWMAMGHFHSASRALILRSKLESGWTVTTTAGFQQIKIYSSMKLENVAAVAAEAHRLGMTVTGHIPIDMNVFQGVEAGMDQVNHVQYIGDVVRKQLPENSSAAAARRKRWRMPT